MLARNRTPGLSPSRIFFVVEGLDFLIQKYNDHIRLPLEKLLYAFTGRMEKVF